MRSRKKSIHVKKTAYLPSFFVGDFKMAKSESTKVSNLVWHPFGPLYDEQSRVLILGSFPSVKSREQQFFYGHPKNRFWPLLAALTGSEIPQTIEEKKQLALKNGIALWDVIASCEIVGSSDSSIRNAKPNDITPILKNSGVQNIFTNGKTADSLYMRYIFPVTKIQSVCLPSTSPANAAWNMERLLSAWQIILKP